MLTDLTEFLLPNFYPLLYMPHAWPLLLMANPFGQSPCGE
jgi:hypothetical protein